jgi:2-polyprenyl-3-methyl-5-hydroxy-6-metoxy-1,4-benzoquinol methylase
VGHPDALVRSWSRNAEAWTRTVREGGIESRRLVTDAAIVRAVLERRPERVLDLGCGEGWLARALAEHGLAVVGLDGSPELVEAARRAGGGEFHAGYHLVDLREPPHPDTGRPASLILTCMVQKTLSRGDSPV